MRGLCFSRNAKPTPVGVHGVLLAYEGGVFSARGECFSRNAKTTPVGVHGVLLVYEGGVFSARGECVFRAMQKPLRLGVME